MKRTRSVKQEEAGAERYGGRRVKGSGNGWAIKNDVRSPGLSIEYKYTDKASYSLKADELEQAEKHALMDDLRDMAFIVEVKGRRWVTISEEYFERLRSNNGHS